MPEAQAFVQLPRSEPARLAAAVHAALDARVRQAAWFREGAARSSSGEWTAQQSARRFQTLLEIGYLVASADGLADQERSSLASLLEKVTAEAIDRATLELHFRDLDEAVSMLGRRERLLRSAAELEDPAAAEEIITLVATIAMADGVLSSDEHAVLVELGRHAALADARVDALVKSAASAIEEGLR